jgi:glycosyltransferase involved in cell wall biosynthesis
MILGLLRVKNESRWIERSITSILPVCDHVMVMDDHSEDSTVEICRTLPKTEIYCSPFSGLDETRDKRWLLEKAMTLGPKWIVFIDGDEALAPGHAERLLKEMNGMASCLSLRVLYLWNDEQHIRVDGVYGDFHRESVFRPNGSTFESTRHGGNFHCGNVPLGCRAIRKVTDIPLLHFGYMLREDRLRKWEFYNSNDSQNRTEGYDPRYPQRRSYPHVIQGDIPEVPASARLMHAGPLQLKAL